jgi:hypothetical protein
VDVAQPDHVSIGESEVQAALHEGGDMAGPSLFHHRDLEVKAKEARQTVPAERRWRPMGWVLHLPGCWVEYDAPCVIALIPHNR